MTYRLVKISFQKLDRFLDCMSRIGIRRAQIGLGCCWEQHRGQDLLVFRQWSALMFLQDLRSQFFNSKRMPVTGEFFCFLRLRAFALSVISRWASLLLALSSYCQWLSFSTRGKRKLAIGSWLLFYFKTSYLQKSLHWLPFYARKQLMLSARLIAIAILSVRLSVCLSHRWISQKRCKLESPNLHRRLPRKL